MAAALKSRFGIEAKLVAGSGGIFEVRVDARVVAAKRGTSFPEEDEIVAAVGAALAPPGTPAAG